MQFTIKASHSLRVVYSSSKHIAACSALASVASKEVRAARTPIPPVPPVKVFAAQVQLVSAAVPPPRKTPPPKAGPPLNPPWASMEPLPAAPLFRLRPGPHC